MPAQLLSLAVRYTHAEIVTVLLPRLNEATLTDCDVPLKASAPAITPLVQVGLPTSDPVWPPLPASAAVDPEVSLSFQ